jgi:hypothetical protein
MAYGIIKRTTSIPAVIVASTATGRVLGGAWAEGPAGDMVGHLPGWASSSVHHRALNAAEFAT